LAEACRSRTDQSRVYQLSPVLKTGRVTGPHALPRPFSLHEQSALDIGGYPLMSLPRVEIDFLSVSVSPWWILALCAAQSRCGTILKMSCFTSTLRQGNSASMRFLSSATVGAP